MKNKIIVIAVIIMSMFSCGESCEVCRDEVFYNINENKTEVLYVCRVQEC